MYDERVLDFDWDAENIQHLGRHRISPAEAMEILSSEPIILDHEIVDGEDRWRALGRTNGLRILVIAFPVRDHKFRPITGWKATKSLIEEHFCQE